MSNINTTDIQFRYLTDGTLIDVDNSPQLGNNINGPSLIKVPDWIANPLGRYYLYFAHHEGRYIRLAYADELTGPWHIHSPGTLQLSQSLFCQSAPKEEDMLPEVLSMIAEGIDGDYPHIASPDVHVEEQTQRIKMYFHGRLDNGTQKTRVAYSTNGLDFKVEPELLGDSYFRVFGLEGNYYAIALGSTLYRSASGVTDFVSGPRLTDQNYRHGAIFQYRNEVFVIWSRAGDCPECLLVSKIPINKPWRDWKLQDTVELHRPAKAWEGADEPAELSRYGGVMTRVHQLRDPGVFRSDGKNYLLYSVAGEQGIAIGELIASYT